MKARKFAIVDVQDKLNTHLKQQGVGLTTDVCLLPCVRGLFVLIEQGQGRLLDPFNADPELHDTKLKAYVIDSLKIPIYTREGAKAQTEWQRQCAQALANGKELPEAPELEYLEPYLLQITVTKESLAMATKSLPKVKTVNQLVRYFCTCVVKENQTPNPALTKLMICSYLLPLQRAGRKLVVAPVFASELYHTANCWAQTLDVNWTSGNNVLLAFDGAWPMHAKAVKTLIVQSLVELKQRWPTLYPKGFLVVANSPGARDNTQNAELLYASAP